MRAYSLIQTFHVLCESSEKRGDQLSDFEPTLEARMEADELAESVIKINFQDLSKESAMLWILLRKVKAHFRLEAARKIAGLERSKVLVCLQELVKNGYLELHQGGWYEVIDPPKKPAFVLKIGKNGLPV
jgi:hypothetical protein